MILIAIALFIYNEQVFFCNLGNSRHVPGLLVYFVLQQQWLIQSLLAPGPGTRASIKHLSGLLFVSNSLTSHDSRGQESHARA